MRYRNKRGKHEATPILTINLTKIWKTTWVSILLIACTIFLGSFRVVSQNAIAKDNPVSYVDPFHNPIPQQLTHYYTSSDLLFTFDPTEETSIVEEPQLPPEEEVPPVEEVMEPKWELDTYLGNDTITTPDGHTLTRYDLPDVYHPGIDFSSVQTYMAYSVIKDRSSAAYQIAWHENAYTDDLGFRRFNTDESYFTINDQEDDYMIALGTYYKPKGTCGDRWLIVTDNGSYTAITGDEKSDLHTDPNHQFKPYGKYANVIEFLIDRPVLCDEVKEHGSVTCLDKFSGTIQYMYRID